MRQQASAFSPASVGNVGVGFDILGHVIEGVGDTVTVRRIDAPEVRIAAIRGATVDLPLDVLFGKPPRMHRDARRLAPTGLPGFDPAGLAAGTYSRVATVVTSDENVPGAASRQVTITLSATIDPGAPGNPADLNLDGAVDGVDLGIMLASWGQGGTGDLNGDGTIDGVDLGILLANWG